jgi:2,3-bisphosphoglycerate-independent phosphoglycerate mutase
MNDRLNIEGNNLDLHVVLLFLDGVGIGKNDAAINPFFNANLPALTSLCGGKLPHVPFKNISTAQVEVIAVNATLGMAGLPQSGTGQTAIFTGVNGSKKFGRHFGPHPPSALRTLIAEKNIFKQLKDIGKSAVFANAFPQKFFDYTELGTRRLTVTTLSCMLSGIPLLTAKELERDEGISADFIRAEWPELGHPNVKPVTPIEAGKHLAKIAAKNDFTLFEYWLTDHAGHSQKMKFAVDVLERFDEFLSGFIEHFNPNNTLLIIISDHGNIEDLSTKSHTRNRVPCIIAGKYRNKIVKRIKNLTHITPAILRLVSGS